MMLLYYKGTGMISLCAIITNIILPLYFKGISFAFVILGTLLHSPGGVGGAKIPRGGWEVLFRTTIFGGPGDRYKNP